jgi:ribonuclease HI
MPKVIDIYTDGATVGHNGKLGTVKEVCLGVWIPHINQGYSRRVPGISNNEAEFKALILAMKAAIKLGYQFVRFNLDSKIVLNRALGRRPSKAKFRNERMDAFQDEVLELEGKFKIAEFRWIPRERNTMADYYSKQRV